MNDRNSRDQRRRLALDAARELLERGGASSLSMRKLASATKMAINTLYAMFGTRDGVLEALVTETIAQRMAALREVDEPASSPIDRLEAFVSASVRHAVQNAGTVKPMYRAAGQLRSLRQAANAVGLEMFTHQLREAVDAGQLRDDVGLEPLALLMMQTVNETSLTWALDEIDDDELEARCRHALAVVLAAAATPAYAEDLHRRLRDATEPLSAARSSGATRR